LEIKKLRKEIQIIFQDPSSLNPRIPIGAIMEPMKVHGHKDDKERKAKTIEILERVGLGASILIDIHADFRRTKTTIGIARLVA
jgi:peptide/nickel transport system ATP-binding protein